MRCGCPHFCFYHSELDAPVRMEEKRREREHEEAMERMKKWWDDPANVEAIEAMRRQLEKDGLLERTEESPCEGEEAP